MLLKHFLLSSKGNSGTTPEVVLDFLILPPKQKSSILYYWSQKHSVLVYIQQKSLANSIYIKKKKLQSFDWTLKM